MNEESRSDEGNTVDYVPPSREIERIFDLAADSESEIAAEAGNQVSENLGEPTLPPDLQPGEMLPKREGAVKRFKIIHPCGAGGEAKVYSAVDRLFPNRATVVKVVKKLGSSDHSLCRLIDEAKTTASRNSEGFTPFIIDWGVEADFAWMAMEKLEGLTLDGLLQSQGRLTWEQAKKVCKDVLEGLRFANARCVIHCDFSPSNVILPSTRGCWMTLDWSLAHTIDENTGVAYDPVISGKAHYMAPECWPSQTDSRGCFSPQSDFYALGIMLAEMLLGEHPIPASSDDPLTVQEALKNLNLAAELDKVADLPEQAKRVVLQATDPDPKKRYPDANAFLKALDGTAKPKWMTRKRRNLLVIAGVLLALGVVLTPFIRDSSPPTHFDGDLDLFVVAEGKERLPKPLVLGGPSARLPLRVDSGVIVQGKLTQGSPPAFFYVLWIRSDGKPNRVYPEGWTAESLPADETEQLEFRWPKENWLPIAHQRDGLELVVWLVRPKRLTKSDHARISALLDDLKWRQPEKWDGKDIARRWINGNLLDMKSRSSLKPVTGSFDDPISQTEKLLQALKDQRLAPFTYAFLYSFVDR